MSEIKLLKKLITETGYRAWLKGFLAGTEGNISVKLKSGDILATPSGVNKGFLKPEMIIQISPEGNVIKKNKFNCSSEIKMHLMVYRERPDIKAVIHCHSTFATTFALLGKDLDELYLAESVTLLGRIRVAPFSLPSTEELAQRLIPFVKESDIVLMERHGVLVLGEDIISAYNRLENLEHVLNIITLSKLIGNPEPLTKEQIELLKEIREKNKIKGRILI